MGQSLSFTHSVDCLICDGSLCLPEFMITGLLAICPSALDAFVYFFGTLLFCTQLVWCQSISQSNIHCTVHLRCLWCAEV